MVGMAVVVRRMAVGGAMLWIGGWSRRTAWSAVTGSEVWGWVVREVTARRPEASAASVFDAIAKGRLGEIESLLASGAPKDACDKDRRTFLHHAVATGNLPVIELLVKQGLE